MKSPYSVFIIDDDLSLANELVRLFESIHYKVIHFTTTQEYLHFLTTHPPSLECTISEFKKPAINGLKLLNDLKEHRKIIPVILVSETATIDMALTSMKAGACDFLEKPLNHQILLDSVNQAIRKYYQATDAIIMNDLTALSAREQEVIRLITKGKLNKEIAHELAISISTVEAHRRSLRKKLKAANNADLIKKYITALTLCA